MNLEITGFLELLTHNRVVVLPILAVMIFLLLCDLATFYIKRFAHRDFKSTIMSLGILGTFIGISIGLWNFDTTSIEGSVPTLLYGLKTAFLTSVLGIFFSIVLAVIQRLTSSGEDATDMAEQIRQQRTELRDGFIKSHETLGEIAKSVGKFDGQVSGLRTELKDQSEQSRKLISGEFAKANQTLAESLQKISEGANKEIIDALNESIRGFNQNLTDQFGENFRRLNDACLKLVEWQEGHKEEVDATHKQLQDSVDALTETKKPSPPSLSAIRMCYKPTTLYAKRSRLTTTKPTRLRRIWKNTARLPTRPRKCSPMPIRTSKTSPTPWAVLPKIWPKK